MSQANTPMEPEFTQRLDWRYIGAYRKALYASRAEHAKAIRRRIESGPADLQREIALTRKAGIATTPEELKLPVLADKDNAATYLRRLATLLKRKPLGDKLEDGLTGTEKLSARRAAWLRKALADREDVFALIHKAASCKGLVMRTEWNTTGYIRTSMCFATGRTAAKLLSARAWLLASGGDVTGAIADLDTAFRLAGLLSQDPLMISSMIGVALHAIGYAGAGRVLKVVGPNEATSAAVASLLARHVPSYGLGRILEGEVVYTLGTAEECRHAAPRLLAECYDLTGWTLEPELSDPPIPARLATVDREFAKNLLDAVVAESLRRMRPLISAARQGPEAYIGAARAMPASDDEDGPLDPVEATADGVAAVMPRAADHPKRPNAYRAVVMAGALVLSHKARTGAWPETLGEAGETPTDPWTGKPLGYRREGDGFVVWSGGETGKFTASPGQATMGEVCFRYP